MSVRKLGEITKEKEREKQKANESTFRLRIAEDTACIPSKTSYMNEDGLDDNGIYYFGKKPAKPKSWKDYIKQKRNKDTDN